SLFTTGSNSINIYNFPNTSANIMQALIEFAYTGAVRITKNNFEDLFIAANFFSVAGITQACCKSLEESLSPQTCFNTWSITNTYYYPELKQKVFSYILTHFREVVTCSGFLQLSVEDLMSFIENDLLNMRHEMAVFEAILLWINHSPQDRQAHMKDLLPKIRLAYMEAEYFSDHVIDNEIVWQSRECKMYLIRTMQQIQAMKRHCLPIGPSSSLYCHTRPRVPQAVLMAVGGWNMSRPTNAIEIYDSYSEAWIFNINRDETPRAYHGTVFLNGCVYVIGGFDGFEQLCTVHKYDLAHESWQEVGSMHSRRCYVSVVLLDGFIYAIGGFDGTERLETAERYSPETNQWTMIASMHNQRTNASSATLHGKIYICGGFNGTECLFTAECYNPRSNQWTLIPDMRSRRRGVSVIAYAGNILAVGGFTGDACLNTVEAYNPETHQWHPLPSMINPRYNFGIAVLDNELYVIGGFNGLTTIPCVERFDIRTGVWSIIDDMRVSRSALSCCIVHDLPNMANYSSLKFAVEEAPEEEISF
ncbi:hypothetical protein NL108_005752, partial [Boleophthalmus pectinirostris]